MRPRPPRYTPTVTLLPYTTLFRSAVLTPRPATLYGASFAAISPDQPLAERLAKDSPELAAFIELCRRQGTAAEQIDTAEKMGFDTGIAVEHLTEIGRPSCRERVCQYV